MIYNFLFIFYILFSYKFELCSFLKNINKLVKKCTIQKSHWKIYLKKQYTFILSTMGGYFVLVKLLLLKIYSTSMAVIHA